MLRPLVAQKQLLSDTVFSAMIASTAKKYDVNTSDLGNIKTLSSDLIREVLENAFLDSAQKIQFCEEIEKWSYKEKDKLSLSIENFFLSTDKIRKTQLSSEYMSAMLGVTAALTALSGSLFTISSDKITKIGDMVDFSEPFLTSIFFPIIATMTVFVIQKIKSKTKKENTEDEVEKESK